jgi:hypothetical protein
MFMSTKKIAISLFAACIGVSSCKKELAEEIKIPPVIVSDANLNGWEKDPRGLATVKFVTPPSTPPLGISSLQLSTPDKSFGRVKDSTHSGTLLSDLTELSYSTYIQQRDSTVDELYIVLLVDTDGDRKAEHNLVFDPRYQTGNFIVGLFPDQGSTKVGTWQTWNALRGGWFIGPNVANDPDHGGWFFSLATFVNKYPNATIMNDAAKGGGSIRFSVGAPVFSNNFIGYGDNFKIGVKGVTTTYDFE